VKVFLVAGERSGDFLGAKLIGALRSLQPALTIAGVGGEAMQREGLQTLFPLADLAIMGFGSVARALPKLLRRIDETAHAAVDFRPDVLVIIDSPDFTHRVARRVRRLAPDIPIVDYVSPSVWAWRPSRARNMRAYVDRVLALLPFEPAAHARLGGPPCTFVGHPLVEHLDELRPNAEEAAARESDEATFLIMPGSRRSEIERLMPVFGRVLDRVDKMAKPLDVILPAVPHLEDDIREELRSWPYKPRVVVGDAAKLAAFRRARAALVASGTATLELALAGVPMAVAYRVSAVESLARHFIRVPSVVLANLVIGDNVVPEFLQERCTVDNLAAALAPLVSDAPARRKQMDAFVGLEARLTPASGEAPSMAAARAVLDSVRAG
jgi:lipid-A-disaccharide synthase